MQKHPDPETHWRHRRRFAYMSFAGLCVIGVFLGIGSVLGSIAEQAIPAIQSLIWSLTSIIGIYVGGACFVEAMGAMK